MEDNTPTFYKVFNYLNGRLDEDGRLLILRHKTYTHQYCIYANNGRFGKFCGDWCPQFGEPDIKNKCTIHLKICQNRILEFSNFEDER